MESRGARKNLWNHTPLSRTSNSLTNLQAESAFRFLSLNKEAVVVFWVHKPRSRRDVSKRSIPVQVTSSLSVMLQEASHCSSTHLLRNAHARIFHVSKQLIFTCFLSLRPGIKYFSPRPSWKQVKSLRLCSWKDLVCVQKGPRMTRVRAKLV